MYIHTLFTIKQLCLAGLISTQTYHCLSNAQLLTVGAIATWAVPHRRLLELPRMGEKGFREVLGVLQGLSPEAVNDVSSLTALLSRSVGAPLAERMVSIYGSLRESGVDTQGLFVARYPDVLTVHLALLGDRANLERVDTAYSLAANNAARGGLLAFVLATVEAMREAGCSQGRIQEAYERQLAYLEAHAFVSYTEVIERYLSVSARIYFEQYMAARRAELLPSMQRFAADNFPTLERLALWFDVRGQAYKRVYRKRIAAEKIARILAFVERLREEFDRCLQLSDQELGLLLLRSWYPELTEEDYLFILSHKASYGYYPRFYMLYQTLRVSGVKRDRVYAKVNGLTDGQLYSWSEVAERVQLSREQVRHLATAPPAVLDSELFKQTDWTPYQGLLDLPYITQDTAAWLSLSERERLPRSLNVYFALLNLVGERNLRVEVGVNGVSRVERFPHQYEALVVEQVVAIVNRARMPRFAAKAALSAWVAAVDEPATARRVLAVGDFVGQVSDAERTCGAELLCALSRSFLGWKVNRRGQLVRPGRALSVGQALGVILEEAGEPLTVEQLFDRFKERHPEQELARSAQLLPFLWGQRLIVPLGESGLYRLVTRADQALRSMRDMLWQRIVDQGSPVLVQELFRYVKPFYPRASASQVRLMMDSDQENRFVRFEGDRYGLADRDYGAAYVLAKRPDKSAQFEVWFAGLKRFVAEHHRLPKDRSNKEEYTMYVWLNYVRTGFVRISEAQRAAFNETMAAYERERIPRYLWEYYFKRNCERYRAFVEEHGALPTRVTDLKLYNWFYTSRRIVERSNDYRKDYLLELLAFLRSVGLYD